MSATGDLAAVEGAVGKGGVAGWLRPARWAVRPAVAVAWAVLALIAVAALWPGLLAGRAPDATDALNPLAHPGSAHWFGTDQLGQDVYSRVVHGARYSLAGGLGATATAVLVGSLLGVLAATSGRAVDELVMRVTDILLAFPGLLLALLVVAVLGPGTVNSTLAISVSMVPGFVRLARGQALVIRDSDYVQAARVLGRSRTSVLLRHLLPNALPPLLVLATVGIGSAIIAGSSLSFLGLGPQPPAPEWGAMLAQGRDLLDISWAPAVFPGAAITLTVLAVNVVGRDLQRRFEGRPADGRR
ncbi:ABC transporter permease [Streptomyces hokutonensis]|uniref:ABC transporter permease n=1 Tax=Streptomyces hokutonensis TaxID=1306990 RepID=A0ABW6M8U1_9ACTN